MLYTIVDKNNRFVKTAAGEDETAILDEVAEEMHLERGMFRAIPIPQELLKQAAAEGIKLCCQERMDDGQCEADGCEFCPLNDALGILDEQ